MSKKPFESGSVSLIGAGPGDPDLLTLRAFRALMEADVVLYDHLVAAPILDLIRRGAARICVGKRAGRASWAQGDINALLITLARKGRQVVRLKAGDPSVFGRSGEEIAALTAAGIPVTVVPGVTTASALAAGLQVSLTHRSWARSLRFVTAHSAAGGLPPDLDWEGLADPATTLVIYMGGRTGPELAARLLAAGRAAQTPVVIGEDVSRPEERFRRMTLGELAAGPLERESSGPVTIAIGEALADAHCGQAAAPSNAGERRMVGKRPYLS